MPNDHEKIRITTDEVERVVLDPPPRSAPPPFPTVADGTQSWGRVEAAASQAGGAASAGTPKLLFKAWIYLGLAGLVGAFVAWALCEPSFHDPPASSRGVGNVFLFPAFVTLVSLGFAVAESVVERSWRKSVLRCVMAVVLGVVLGFVFDFIAEAVYHIGLRALYDSGVRISAHNPLLWIVRAIAWSVFGVTGGVVYGIAGQSAKKCVYGIIGGIIGAAVGGLLFDPIYIVAGIAGPSRCLGMAVMGACTGVAIGLVESALKDRWLYVSGGPLAGKQFILYKPQTNIGRDQSNDIYLFKDPAVQPHHAVIDLRSGKAVMIASAPTLVSGQPTVQRVLQNGDLIQIGRYSFNYQEKPRPA